MKRRLLKKYQNAEKMMGKRLSGRYAQTIARRIHAFGSYDFWCCDKPKTNTTRKYIITTCVDYEIDCAGIEHVVENGFFCINRV